METIVIWLAVLVALAVDHASARNAGIAGGALALAAVALAAAARRRLRGTLGGGRGLQALVISAGARGPGRYFLGPLFARCWVYWRRAVQRAGEARCTDRAACACR